MGTSVAGPFNLVQGQPTVIPNTEWPSPDQTGSIVVANNSGTTLTANVSGSTKYVYPNSADVFSTDGGTPTISALQNQSLIEPAFNPGGVILPGVYVGTFTATYYDSDEPPPVGFPTPLPPTSGGSEPLFANLQIQVNPSFGPGFLIQPGADVTQLVFTGLSGGGFTLPPTFQVYGATTGKLYNPPAQAFTNGVTVGIAAASEDELFWITLAPSGTAYTCNITCYQLQTPIPTQPNIFLSTTAANVSQVLPVPPTGWAYYVFRTRLVSAASGMFANWYAGSVGPVANLFSEDYYDGVAEGNYQWSQLQGIPITTAINIAYSVNQAGVVTIAYALGPS